ncbi:MAG TPA: hypothetical protein VN844_05285 [Pyrinomonadaceae bacterium]|nr:hypothetical protein [Pyrinomonadaceae bacterium]
MKTVDLSSRVYKVLLIAYPSAFRREYGHQMQQVFRDRYRDEARRNGHLAVAGYWMRTVLDLALTAAREHSENFRKDNIMRRDLISLAGCIAIIATAFALLSYGRTHEVSSILIFGRTLDAIVTAGVIGNLIVFLLVKMTRRDSFQIALWSFLVVHAVLAIIVAIIGPRVEAQFRFGPILLGYILSFLFWLGLHWAWQLSKRQLAKSDA